MLDLIHKRKECNTLQKPSFMIYQVSQSCLLLALHTIHLENMRLFALSQIARYV